MNASTSWELAGTPDGNCGARGCQDQCRGVSVSRKESGQDRPESIQVRMAVISDSERAGPSGGMRSSGLAEVTRAIMRLEALFPGTAAAPLSPPVSRADFWSSRSPDSRFSAAWQDQQRCWRILIAAAVSSGAEGAAGAAGSEAAEDEAIDFGGCGCVTGAAAEHRWQSEVEMTARAAMNSSQRGLSIV